MSLILGPPAGCNKDTQGRGDAEETGRITCAYAIACSPKDTMLPTQHTAGPMLRRSCTRCAPARGTDSCQASPLPTPLPGAPNSV